MPGSWKHAVTGKHVLYRELSCPCLALLARCLLSRSFSPDSLVIAAYTARETSLFKDFRAAECESVYTSSSVSLTFLHLNPESCLVSPAIVQPDDKPMSQLMFRTALNQINTGKIIYIYDIYMVSDDLNQC